MAIKITDRSPSADRERREQLGISADDLAARAEISAQELTSYEQAKSETDANPAVAMKIGDALDALENELKSGGLGDNEPEDHPS